MGDFLKMFVVREGNLDDVLVVHKNIIEFDDKYPSKDFFLDRYKDNEHVIIVSYFDDLPVGYVIGYKINEDNFYCWLAGVDINYRKNRLLTSMMEYLISWCFSRNYKTITIKTRNRYRNMLLYLVKNNWNFINIEMKDNVSDYRINLELDLR